MATYSPSARQRRISIALINWRERAGLKRGEAAQRAGWSASTQTRLEEPSQLIKPFHVSTLGQVCKIPEGEREKLFEDCQASMQPGWWDQIEKDAVIADVRGYIELESTATKVRYFQNAVVPSLLQEFDYGVAVAQRAIPRVDDATITSGVDVRIQRQRRLNDEDFQVEAILTDNILRDGKIPPSILKKQRQKLVDLAALPGVELRLLTPECGTPLVGTSFSILSFGKDDPDIGYLELPGEGVFLEGEKVGLFDLAYQRLWEDSLNAEESLKLIAELG